MNNIRPIDRFLRLALAIILLQAGYFWLASPWSWLAYGVALVLLVTALVRYCPIYGLIGIRTNGTSAQKTGPLALAIALVALAALTLGGSYASAFFTRKIFLEDFNAMNHFYKQTLFLTGQDKRPEAISNLDQLKPAFSQFASRYSTYRPYSIKGDAQLEADFATVSGILSGVEPLIRSGDLHQAHLDLEKIRPVFQEMFKRNGFSMLSVALVEFHDAMETILEAANAKDAAKAISLHPSVSDKLKIVEAEANDGEIQAIRAALEDLLATAQAANVDALPAKADTLKTSFVKVYLKRG
jgi:hypothetical protein